MAIDIKRSFYGWTDSQAIAIGETVNIEGQGLVAVLEDNIEKVKPATGGAGEKFVGFARFRQLQFGIGAKVEAITVPVGDPLLPAPVTVTLSKHDLIEYLVTGCAVPPTVDTVAGTVTFAVADLGKNVTVGYRWNMTVAEAKTTMYEAPVNMPDPNMAGMVGVGKGKSRIYTDNYDGAVAYTAASTLTLKAGGVVTVGGIGAVITGARVVQVPSATDAYLGIEFLV